MAADVQEARTDAPRTDGPRSKGGRFVGFLVVGATGLLVNQLAFWMLADVFNLHYMYAFLLATQFSTVWNFVLLERFVFSSGRDGRWARFGWYALMNNIWNVASAPLMYGLTTGLRVDPLLSNWLVVCGMTVVRFAISNNLIWADRDNLKGASAMRDGKRIWNYDVHGIIGIASESRLPELIRFQVPSLVGPADIEVVVSNDGFGGLRKTVDVVEEGSTISYVEHLGRHGFAAKINTDTLAHIQVSKLLRRSPHVAYTNVVEPVVRWVMVRKGYILAHAACLQIDGHGVLITARTDTGKTTTCLKSIKEQGTGFVSDDMVIIDHEGNALSYPKPLTISSHTLNAVKGAPMPWRTRAWLQVQGRLHSKFGRSVGMAFGNINLPVASMSAIVQMIIPPPKFQVDRLIPGAEMVPALKLDRLVVIERGDATLQELDSDAAFEILSENTEDAYGFPPYPRIGHALSNGELPREQDIRRKLMDRLEAVLLRTPDRAWFEMLPRLAAGIRTAPGTAVVDVTNEEEVVLDLTGVGEPDDAPANVISMDERGGDPVASRFEKLSPTEAEEVERALSGALALLQKVSDILDGQNENDEPAVSGLVASVRSLRDARMPQGKR
jgi:dolichol-phosphate mannosyltransferase